MFNSAYWVNNLRILLILVCLTSLAGRSFAQNNNSIISNTSIKGFVDVKATFEKNKLSFGLGEQDLFITSELSDRFSFLGESVFKYDAASQTEFSVSIERIVLKYNIKDNHNILIGKHHTPLNYWNDTYHHGRLFFPTIERPLLFAADIIPLHTTGVSLQGHDLGKIKFGYDFLVGNGLGSSEISDNDKAKSVSAAIHIKPIDKLRIGASYYHDKIAQDAHIHGRHILKPVDQNLFSGSIAYFGKKVEVLTEGTLAENKTDSTGSRKTSAFYFYGGYKVNKKLTSYLRFDDLHFQNGELFYTKNNSRAFLLGLRYQLNFLAVLKLEFQHQKTDIGGNSDKVVAQVAVGF
jgi:hypothetical protein